MSTQRYIDNQEIQRHNSVSSQHRDEQEDIKDRRTISEEDLIDNEFTPRIRRCDSTWDKNKERFREYEKEDFKNAEAKVRENAFRTEDK